MNNPGKAPLYPLFAGYRNFEIVLEPPSPGASRFQALRVRRRQTVLQPVLSHFNCLMSADRQVRARSSSTQQRKSRLAVLRKKSQGIGLVDLAGSFDPARAGQAPTLMTKRGQFDSLFERRIPDVLIICHPNGTLFLRCQQRNVEKLRRIGVVVHEGASCSAARLFTGQHLRVARLVCLTSDIERSVLAVGSVAGLAAAEVAAGDRFSIALEGQ